MEIRVSESFGVKRVNYPSTLGYKLFDENEQCGLHGPNDGSVRAEKQILTKKKNNDRLSDIRIIIKSITTTVFGTRTKLMNDFSTFFFFLIFQILSRTLLSGGIFALLLWHARNEGT